MNLKEIKWVIIFYWKVNIMGRTGTEHSTPHLTSMSDFFVGEIPDDDENWNKYAGGFVIL